MPSPDYTPTSEDTMFNAAVLQTNFDDIQDAINAIPSAGVARGGFTRDHLPSQVLDTGNVLLDATATHTYTGVYPGYAVSSGWELITEGGTPLQLQLNDTYSITDPTVIIARANIVLSGMAGGISLTARIWFALQMSEDGISWITIRMSERFVNKVTLIGQPTVHTVGNMDVPLLCVVNQDDPDRGGYNVQYIRVVVSVENATSATLHHGNLSYVVLRAEKR